MAKFSCTARCANAATGWRANIVVLAALAFFGVFVVLLYVATERISWVIVGTLLFAGGAYLSYQLFANVRTRVSVWLDVPLERLIDRVPAVGRRPLAADRAGFEHLYHQRRAAYEQAHKRLDAGRAGVDALVEQLLDWLQH